MKILIIGYKGYVGSGLYRYFNEHCEVLGWGKKEDICNLSKDFLLKEKIDVIINCATFMERNKENFLARSNTFQVNIEGMTNLVKQLEGTRIKLIYISTKDVFGLIFKKDNIIELDEHYKLPHFVSDDCSFNPTTAYGKSKLIGEYIAETHPFHNIIRLSTCYTDFDHYRGHWIPNLIKSINTKSQITLSNKGKQLRAPLHVDDLGGLIQLILESKKNKLKLNADGGKKNLYSLIQIVKFFNSTVKINFENGDDYGFAFTNYLAKNLIGWKPKILIKDKLDLISKNVQNKVSAI